MKTLAAFLLFTFAQTLAAEEDWVEKNILISKGTLLCDDSHLKKALKFEDAGDADALVDFFEKGYCIVAPEDFYANVTDEKSLSRNESMIEILIEVGSAWLGKSSASCCYEKVDDEWEKTTSIEISQLLSDNSECGRAKRYLAELKAAGFAGTTQYTQQEKVKEEKCQ